jgi:hypothetical protein
VVNYGDTLKPYVDIYFSNSSFSPAEIQGWDIEGIEARIERWKVENTKLEAFPQEIEMGLFFCQNKTLKEQIKNCAMHCLTETYMLLPEMLLANSKAICEELAECNMKIGIEPKSVHEFLEFTKNLNDFTLRVEDLSDRVSEMGKLDILITKNRNFMNESSESLKQKSKKYLESQQLLFGLREKIDQANMAL